MLAGVGDAAHLEVVGRGERGVRQHAEALGLDPGRLLPLVGRDVQAVVDGGAAEVDQLVAEGVPAGPLGLGDGEGDEVPAAVPAPAGGVLVERQTGPLHALAHGADGGGGGVEAGLAALALANEQALGHQAPQARPHLLDRLPARLGHRVELVGLEAAVVADHAEHQHTGGHLGRPAEQARRCAPRTDLRRAPVVSVTVVVKRDRRWRSNRHPLTSCAGRTPSCSCRPSVPSGDRRGRWASSCTAGTRSTGSPGRSAGSPGCRGRRCSPATSRSDHVAMGLTLTRPRRSRATIGAVTRLSASARRRPLIHAALPLRARSSWPTLTAEQQFSGSACHSGSSWRATVMIRRFSP